MRSFTRQTTVQLQATAQKVGVSQGLLNFSGRTNRFATAALLVALVTGMSGCKAMPLKMPTLPKPDLSKMAFWKNENFRLASSKDSKPKPPARSFSPSSSKTSIASNSDTDNSAASTAYASSTTTDKAESPVRKPYSEGFKSKLSNLAKLGDKTQQDGFNFAADAPKTALPNFDTDLAKVKKAQVDFNSALASSRQAVSKSIEADNKKAGEWKNDFSLPDSLKQTKSAASDSMAAINKQLYDKTGQLASAAKKNVDNSFASAGDTATKKLSLFEERLKSAATGTSDSIAQSAKAVTDKVATKTNSLAGDTLASTKSEVEQLKAQLAELKTQQQEFLKTQQAAQQQAAVAQNTPLTTPQAPQMYPSTAPLRTASANNHFAGSNTSTTVPPNLSSTNFNPTNVLRGNFSPVQSSEYGSAPRSNQGYPATSHGGYAPRSSSSGVASPSSNAQASFTNRMDANGNLVITASTGSATDSSTVSSIPDAILRGDSSYAPGSVQPLRR